MQTWISKSSDWETTRQSIATDPTAGPNGNGRSVIAEPNKNITEAGTQSLLKSAFSLNQSDDPELRAVSNTLVRLALVENSPTPTMSLAEREKFRTDTTNLTADQINTMAREYYGGGNTPSAIKLNAYLEADRLASEKQEEALAKFLAYKRNSVEECVDGQWETIGGHQFCNGRLVTRVSGDIFGAIDSANAIGPYNAALNTHFYGEDQYLEQLFQYGNNWLSGNSLYGYSNAPLTIGEIFENGLADGLGTGIDNLFNEASMSINQFENQLTSGFNSGGFYRSDFSNGGSLRFQDTVRNALSNTPGASALQAGQFNQLLQAIIAAIINAVLNQN